MARIKINFLNTHNSIIFTNIKKIWIYEYNPILSPKKYGLAIADDNWTKKTILISTDLKMLDSLKKEITISYALGKKNVDIKE